MFGDRQAFASIDLPGRNAALAAGLGFRHGIDGEILVSRHSLLPYYLAFQPEPCRQTVKQEMIEGAAFNVHLLLGVSTFSVRPPRSLRFCDECRSVQLADLGEGAWLRHHQLPGSVVCHHHGTPLFDSEFVISRLGRHDHVPLLADTRGQPIIGLLSSAATDRLIAISLAQHRLCDLPIEPKGTEDWKDWYRDQIRAVGLMRSFHKVDQTRLSGEIASYFSEALQALPSPCRNLGEGGWPAAIVRSHRKMMHPLIHVLMTAFLNDAARVADPFGAGPWPCPNRLSPHCGELRVSRVGAYRNRDTVIGVFDCDCGYTYTRSLRPDGSLDRARLRTTGPLLEPALRRLVVPGASMRAVAREVGLDPKTMMREAAELGVPLPWGMSVSGRPRGCSPRANEGEVLNSTPQRKPASALKHWTSIDAEISVRIRHAVAKIRMARPPERVTVSAIEVEVARRGWLSKRATKLPRSSALLASSVETSAMFRRRRIASVLDRLAPDPPVWLVAREAGIRTEWRLPIDDEIKAQSRRSRAARTS